MPFDDLPDIGGDVTFNGSLGNNPFFGLSYSIGVGLFTSNGEIYGYVALGAGLGAQVVPGQYFSFDGIVFSEGIDPAVELAGWGSVFVTAAGVEAGVVRNSAGKVIGVLSGFQKNISLSAQKTYTFVIKVSDLAGALKYNVQDLSGLHCFVAGTTVNKLGLGIDIRSVKTGDLVLAFDPLADSGHGALTEKRVTKLYRNVTREWIELDLGEIDPETGEAKTLTCTPGHHFLDEFGAFPTIAEMLLRGGGVARIVMEDGSIRAVAGKRIVWSEQNAHLYGGRARQAGWTDGSVALAEAEVDGWQTTDFEVEDLCNRAYGLQ